MRRQLTAMLALSLLVLAATACDDKQTKNRETDAIPGAQEPQAQVGRAAPEEQNLRTQKVEVFNDRVNPRQLQMMAAEPVQLEVTNRGTSPCTFFIGNYVTALQVTAGETVRQSLTLPGSRPRETVDMGCNEDKKRQGKALIEFRGVAPGAGR